MTAYKFAVKSLQGVKADSLVVVKNTISPATDGAVDGRSPLGTPPELVTPVRLRVNIVVAERVPLHTGHNPHNRYYLATKAGKLGHMLGNEHQGEVPQA